MFKTYQQFAIANDEATPALAYESCMPKDAQHGAPNECHARTAWTMCAPDALRVVLIKLRYRLEVLSFVYLYTLQFGNWLVYIGNRLAVGLSGFIGIAG